MLVDVMVMSVMGLVELPSMSLAFGTVSLAFGGSDTWWLYVLTESYGVANAALALGGVGLLLRRGAMQLLLMCRPGRALFSARPSMGP